MTSCHPLSFAAQRAAGDPGRHRDPDAAGAADGATHAQNDVPRVHDGVRLLVRDERRGGVAARDAARQRRLQARGLHE